MCKGQSAEEAASRLTVAPQPLASGRGSPAAHIFLRCQEDPVGETPEGLVTPPEGAGPLAAMPPRRLAAAALVAAAARVAALAPGANGIKRRMPPKPPARAVKRPPGPGRRGGGEGDARRRSPRLLRIDSPTSLFGRRPRRPPSQFPPRNPPPKVEFESDPEFVGFDYLEMDGRDEPIGKPVWPLGQPEAVPIHQQSDGAETTRGADAVTTRGADAETVQ